MRPSASGSYVRNSARRRCCRGAAVSTDNNLQRAHPVRFPSHLPCRVTSSPRLFLPDTALEECELNVPSQQLIVNRFDVCLITGITSSCQEINPENWGVEVPESSQD
jgi:hypothetical protein